MFGKLIKYELRYLIRIFAPMWAAVLALCVVCRITIGTKFTGDSLYLEGSEAILPVFIGVITVFAIMTMMIVAAVVLIQRFYKGMYGDEGYLMFTLPVTTGQLIHSKAITALLMMLGTELLTVLGILVMTSYPEIWRQLVDDSVFEMFQAVLEMNGVTGAEFALYVFWSMIASVVVTASEIYIVYFAISLGQLWKKHPIAGGILAFYGMNLIVSAIEAMVGFNTDFVMMENVIYEGSFETIMIYAAVRGLVMLVVSFFGTKLILDKKLNIA